MSDGVLKILLVDDDALVRAGTADLLADLGHGVCEAGSGEQALLQLGQSPDFDVVITDFSMPNMNGLDLARQIRQAHCALPIIIATGYGEMRTGAEVDVTWLIKPYLQDDLVRTLDKAIGRV
jgi:CheY-like chemotaxis protein